MRKTLCVWELTLKCLACVHCGVRAGRARGDELTAEEALAVVDQLADIGIDEVTLMGGEVFLRSDYLQIAAAIVQAGMLATIVTGGYGLSAEMVAGMRDAGVARVAVSIDGLKPTHDHLRSRAGSWRAALAALGRIRDAGLSVACNTQINRLTAPELPRLYEHLRAAGVKVWMLSPTVPVGHAAARPDIMLQPVEILDVYPMLAALKLQADADGISLQLANDVGYFGPFDPILRRGDGLWELWSGCQAGLNVLGLEADGTVKACASLPTTSYAGGNVREGRLREIVATAPELGFNLGAGTPESLDALWGFCRTCRHAALCRAGCTGVQHVLFGRRGNNPYCHHRALEQQRQGLRERLVAQYAAPGLPLDHGLFELVEEPFDAPWPEPDPLRFQTEKLDWGNLQPAAPQ